MKKRLLTAAFFVGAWSAYSQVGIGTLTPNNSSQLDVVANNKGILIPRIGLESSTDATTVTKSGAGYENSLLVFNTNTQNDITPGYYYWYVDRWMRIINQDDVVALDKNTTNTSLTVTNNELVLTDSEGNTVSIPLSEINIPTSFVKNPDGTYTYTNEAGESVTIDPKEVAIALNPTTNKYEFKNSAGVVIGEIDANADALAFDNTDNGFASDNVQDALEELKTTIDTNKGDLSVSDGIAFTSGNGTDKLLADAGIGIADGGVTTDKLAADAVTNDKLADNAVQSENILDGTIATVDLADSAVTEDKMSSVINNGGTETPATAGQVPVADGSGGVTYGNVASGNVTYDNRDSGLTANNTQDAIDELADNVDNLELDGDVTGSLGNTVVGAIQGTDVSATQPTTSGQTLVYNETTEQWEPAVLGAENVDYDNTNSGLTADDTQGAIDELANNIGDLADTVDGLADGDITSTDITVTGGDNATFTDVTLAIANGAVTTDKLAADAVTNDKLADNAVQSENIADGTIATADLANDAVTADKINEDVAGAGLIQDTDGSLAVDPAAVAALADGDITSTDITVTGGDNATFTDVTLAITHGTAGQVMVTNPAGTGVTWVDQSEIVPEGQDLTAALNDADEAGSETIEITGGTGATLVDASLRVKEESITTDHIQDGTIAPEDLADGNANQVLVTNEDGTPEWKDAEKVTPRFFYMPAVIFDTSEAGENLTRDLYQDYVNQFTGVATYIADGANGPQMQYTGGLVGSADAPAAIAVFENDELYYYVTYYDQNVFENLEIDAEGVLTYDIKEGASATSYMNIVFVIK